MAGVAFRSLASSQRGPAGLNISSRIEEMATGPDGIATFDWLPADNDKVTFWPVPGGYVHRRVPGVERGRDSRRRHDSNRVDSRSRTLAGRTDRLLRMNIRAYGTGRGMDNGQGHARTRAKNGYYELPVNPGEAYAVYVDDQDWAAPSRLDVVVREGKPVEGVDFKLSPPNGDPRNRSRWPRQRAAIRSVHPAR